MNGIVLLIALIIFCFMAYLYSQAEKLEKKYFSVLKEKYPELWAELNDKSKGEISKSKRTAGFLFKKEYKRTGDIELIAVCESANTVLKLGLISFFVLFILFFAA